VSNLPPLPPQPGPGAWPMPPAPHRPSRRLAIASFAIAVIAVGVAIGSWFRPVPDNKPPAASPPPTAFTEQQTTDAKEKVCQTYEKVHQAVLTNTGRSGGSDAIALLGVAANARLALYDGGEYLLKTLAQQPATPPELATAIQQLVDSYQLLAINYMA